MTFVHQEIPDFREWVGKGRQWYLVTITLEYASKACSILSTAAAKGLEQGTVHAVQLQSSAQGCENVKVDV